MVLMALMVFLMVGCIGEAIYNSGSATIGGNKNSGEVGKDDGIVQSVAEPKTESKDIAVTPPSKAKAFLEILSKPIEMAERKIRNLKFEVVAVLALGIFSIGTILWWIRKRSVK